MNASRSSLASSLARSKPLIAENWKQRVVPFEGKMITIYIGYLKGFDTLSLQTARPTLMDKTVHIARRAQVTTFRRDTQLSMTP